MSVDTRIVKLQFDNEQFEKGVSKSMRTLDELESKLQFEKSAKGFGKLQDAADSIKFDRLVDSIEAINSKLSATGIIAAKLVSSIASSVAGAVKKVEEASLGQIKSGGWARAMKIENAKFAVQGLKGDWDELYKAIDYSVSGTAYGVDAAAKAASTLMASGVDYMKTVETKDGQQLTQMHKSLRAISGVAAQTNSEFDDIAHIFTTVAGNGRLMADQLNQLSGRGMNAAAILGEQLGMTEAAVREATSKGQIDFKTFADAMDNAFGDHAKDANKTFTGSLSNMKAALSRFGAVFATPIIQKTNTFFIALTGKINEMKKAIADVTQNGVVLEEHLEGHFAKMWENLITLASNLVGSIDLTWFKKIADSADRFVQRVSNALEIMNAFASSTSSGVGKTVKEAYDLTTITEGELDAAYKIIRGEFGNGAERKRQLEKYLQENELNYDPDKLQGYVNVLSKVGYILDKAGIKIVKETDAIAEENDELYESQMMVGKIFSNVYLSIHNFNVALSKLKENIGGYISAITSAFGGFVGIAYTVTDLIKSLISGFNNLVDAIKPSEDVLISVNVLGQALAFAFDTLISNIKKAVGWVTEFIKSVMDYWKESGILSAVIEDIAVVIANLTQALHNLATTAGRIFKAIATAFFRVFNPAKATGLLAAFSGGISGLSEAFYLSEDAAEALTDVLTVIFGAISKLIDAVTTVVGAFFSLFGIFRKSDKQSEEYIDNTEEMAEGMEDVGGAVEDVGEAAEKAGGFLDKLIGVVGKVVDFFGELFKQLKESEGVKRLGEAFNTLFSAMKMGLAEGVDTVSGALSNIGEDKSPIDTVTRVANAISWLADKLADFVEAIPPFITKVENFFSKFPSSITDAFKNAEGKLDFSFIKDDILNAIGMTPEFASTAKNTIKEFATGVANFFGDVDFKGIVETALAATGIFSLFKLTRMFDAFTSFGEGLSQFINTLSRLGNSLVKGIKQVARAFQLFSAAALIGMIALSIVAIVGAIYFLTKIPKDDMYDAASLIIVIMLALSILIKSLTGLTKVIANARVSIAKERTNQLKTGATIKELAVVFGGIALLVIVLAASIKMLLNAFKEVIDLMQNYNSDQVGSAALALGVALAGVLAIAIIASVITKLIVNKMRTASTSLTAAATETKMMKDMLIGVGVFILGLAGAIYLIVKSMGELNGMGTESDKIQTIMLVMVGMILSISLGLAAILYAARGVQPKALAIVAVLMIEVVIMLAVIMAGVIGLAMLLTVEKFAKVEDQIGRAAIIIGGVLLVIATTMFMIMKGVQQALSSGKATEAMKMTSSLMLGMVFIIGILVIGLTLLAKEIGKLDNDAQIAGLIGVMFILLLIVAALSTFAGGLAKAASSMRRARDFKNVSVAIEALGYMVFMIALAIAGIIAVLSLFPTDTQQLGIVMLVLIAVVGMMGLMMEKISSSSGTVNAANIKTVSESYMALAGAVLIIAVALGILVYVASNINKNNLLPILGVLGTVVIIVAGLAALTKLLNTLGSGAAQTLLSFAAVIAAFGVVVILVAAAAMVLSSLGDDMWGSLLGAFAIIGVITLVIAALMGLAAIPAVATGLPALSKLFLALGASFTLFGAGILLAAIGLTLLNPALDGFTVVLEKLSQVIEAHQGTIIGIAIFIVTIMVITFLIIRSTLPALNSLVTAVTTAITTIFGALKTFGKAIISGIEGFAKNDKIRRSIKMVIATFLVSAISALNESGPEVLQKLGKFILMVLDWIAEGVPKIIEKLLQILLKIINGLTDAIFRNVHAISAAIMGMLLALAGVIAIVLKDIVRTVVYGLFGEGKITRWIVEGIGSKMEGAVDKFKRMSNEMRTEAEELDKALAETGDSVSTWEDLQSKRESKDEFSAVTIGHDLQEVMETDGGRSTVQELTAQEESLNTARINNFRDFVKARNVDLKKYAVIGKKMENIATAEAQALAKAGEGFYGAGEDDSGVFYKIEQIDLANFDMLAQRYYMRGEELAEATTSGVEDGVQQASTGGLLDGLTDKAGDALGGLKDKATDAIGGFNIGDSLGLSGSGLSDLTGQASTTGTLIGGTTGMSANDALANCGVDINDTASFMGEDAASSFTDSFNSGMVVDASENEKAADTVVNTTAKNITDEENQEKMREAGKLISSEGIRGVETTSFKWKKAGEMIVEGLSFYPMHFATGGVDQKGSARWLANQMYEAMYDDFVGPKQWDVNSPSKRMLKIGQYIIQGLTNGIYDEQSNAVTSVADLSSAMLSAFSNPLDYVAKVSSGEYAYDPSIRPVLDTSLVARGAYGINSLFDNQNVSLNGISGTIAADIGRLDNSNADIIAELKALRSEMTVMGEQIGNMQVVMDSGRLVGAIATDMDRTLGNTRMYGYRGKGN